MAAGRLVTLAESRSDCRILFVHAHPDDETITTGGSIARYLDEGADVLVVTCTLGEEGEVIGAEWAGLAADLGDGRRGADQLGGFRIGELTAALAALTPAGRAPLRPHFLGGAGRWRDSGMVGTASTSDPRAFTNAGDGPVAALAALIREFRPQVLVGYDEVGSYGHPDHVQVNRICGAAIERAADTWTVSKHYWTVAEDSALRSGLEAARDRVPPGWTYPASGELPSHPDAEITTAVDVSGVFERKVAGLAAHATQVTVSESGTEYALSNNVIQPIFDEEHFMLVGGRRGPVGPDGRERDLFAGLD